MKELKTECVVIFCMLCLTIIVNVIQIFHRKKEIRSHECVC